MDGWSAIGRSRVNEAEFMGARPGQKQPGVGTDIGPRRTPPCAAAARCRYSACRRSPILGSNAMDTKQFAVTHTDAEWRRLLTREQYEIMRQHGTEAPGSCALNFEKRAGAFSCAGCDQVLFKSKKKFESGTGWPSFNDPEPGSVEETVDRTYGMVRTEVHCSRCGSHLGHVCPDGPPPTGLRYCINGVAMNFKPD